MNSNENVLEISRAQNGRATGAKEASAYAEPQAGAPAQPSRAEPASRSSDYYIALADKYVAHIYEPLNVVIERGEGVWVWDVEGNRYLDCLSAYSALNQGHVHPRIMAAAVAQMGRVTLTSRAFRNSELGPFLEELCTLSGYEMALPMNTGAEAVETAIKVVRKWGYETKSVEKDRAEIIVCEGNFHGRTTTIVGFSSKEKYREGFGPFTPGFVHIPYGDARALEAAITPNTVGFLVEPVQGEGGVCVPPVGYLKRAAEICQAHDVLLMADEIQTGLGRTGRLFASEHEGVRPDVMILGKALSGGFYPVSAVLADEPVLGLLEPGHHGSTFGGNPLGAAIAREALRVLVEEDLVSRAALLGDYLLQCLREIDSPHVKEVRGKGLLIGVELDKAARPFAETLRDWGVLVKETQGTVLRIAPPLVIEKEEVDWALERIARVLTMR